MSLQFSVLCRNAMLDAIETNGGTSPIMRIYDLSAAAPGSCEAAITGGTLATITLPADWMTAASGGSMVKTGTWSDTSADAAGTADFFRIYRYDGGTCFLQGSVGVGLDMTLDNYVVAAGQTITISTFAVTAGNA
jgi:hypothetical protein